MARRRHLSKFTDAAASVTYTFPSVRYEWETSQGLRVPVTLAGGAHYGYRLLGDQPGLKDVASERVRFALVGIEPYDLDDEIDEIRSKLHSIGLGKLWTLGADTSERWAWASLAEMPNVSNTYDSPFVMPVVANFARFSDWYGAEDDDEESATSNVVINNPGNAYIHDLVIILRASSWTNPVVTNSTTGQVLSTSRDISSTSHRIRFDTARHAVEWSTNSGSSYADDYSNFSRAAGQVGLMSLAPGNNTFTFSGSRSSSFFRIIRPDGAWH